MGERPRAGGRPCQHAAHRGLTASAIDEPGDEVARIAECVPSTEQHGRAGWSVVAHRDGARRVVPPPSIRTLPARVRAVQLRPPGTVRAMGGTAAHRAPPLIHHTITRPRKAVRSTLDVSSHGRILTGRCDSAEAPAHRRRCCSSTSRLNCKCTCRSATVTNRLTADRPAPEGPTADRTAAHEPAADEPAADRRSRFETIHDHTDQTSSIPRCRPPRRFTTTRHRPIQIEEEHQAELGASHRDDSRPPDTDPSPTPRRITTTPRKPALNAQPKTPRRFTTISGAPTRRRRRLAFTGTPASERRTADALHGLQR